jgi:putative ABC transport system permease protein
VAGVVANFHQEGLQKPISPLVVFLRPGLRNSWSVKLSSALTSQTITSVKKIWDRHFPGDPFSYFYLDDFFDRQYAEDRRFGQVFGLFATFAILIACFGLLGLSAYNVLQRTKEIGIRKVLGASVQQLLFILSKDFLVLVAISFLIAIPSPGSQCTVGYKGMPTARPSAGGSSPLPVFSPFSSPVSLSASRP